MNQGGRPRDTIWYDFLRVSENGKVQAKCKHCGYVLSNRVERMKGHVKKCEKKIRDCDIEDNKNCEGKTFTETSNETPTPCNKRPCIQNEIKTYFVKTDQRQKNALDLQVAKFFYACNISFLASENAEFVKLCELLRPGYSPPTRKQLADELLDEVYSGLNDKMKRELEGKEGTLIEDGWSNIHNEPVIASTLQVEGKAYFLRAIETGSNSKTGEFCKENALQSVKEAKEKFGCSVRSFVTDNAKNMEKMRNLLHKEDSNLLVYGCSAHWLNLLGQDITPSQIVKPIVEVQKYFRNHHAPSAWLKESNDTVKPQLPNDTRWNSILTCIQTYLRNRHAYIKIAEEHKEDIDDRIDNLINNFNLYKQAQDLSSQLKPIASALDQLQRDDASLSDACHTWVNLVQCPQLQPHEAKVKTRMNQALAPFHYLAYMSHPYAMGELLSEDQREKGRQWLLDCQPENLDYLVAFEAQATPFPASFFRASTLPPATWWKATKRSKLPENFINLMVRLHSAPCSSASVERVFSNFGHIQSKIRNRLGIEKATKIVYCYRMLRGSVDME